MCISRGVLVCPARRSRDLRIAADQETTEEWWTERRVDFELFNSETVLHEAAQGDAVFATKRLAVLAGLPRLSITVEADVLVARLLRDIIPANAAPDAVHLALSAVHGMKFLLT